jgi:two-component system sensor histidine kinase UhpB
MARLPDFAGKTSREGRPSPATLHGRVMGAALTALAFSLAVGAAALLWDARRSVDVELGAARASAVQAVRTGLRDAGGAKAQAEVLKRLVQIFDGNRHVRARLLDAAGRSVLTSVPLAPSASPPKWLVVLIDPRLAPLRLATPAAATGFSAIVIEADPINEIGEAWAGLRDALLIVALLSVLALILIRRAVIRALRPLEAVSGALARVGAGDFEARVGPAGTAELERLGQGFNAMAGQLDSIDRENRRLHEQLLTVQEEERAELARDLHDEIGPYLFAVSIDAAAVRDLAVAGQTGAVPGRLDLIQAAVGHMQTQVSDMLRRLRPLRAVEFGLACAVEDLVAFWRARRPDIVFDLTMTADDVAFSLGVREALYRVAQEALSNAVRHGAPSHIAVEIGGLDGGFALLRITDNGAAERAPGGRPRFGLTGMRERLSALGGELAIEHGAGTGWRVTARAPLRTPETVGS